MPNNINTDEHASTQEVLRDYGVLERHTLDDGETVALFNGEARYGLLLVVNESDDATATVRTEGPGNNAAVDHGASFGNGQGTSANNVYHDGSDYVLENSTGSDGKTYAVVGQRVV